jgi:hypothetical protein
MIPSFHSRSLAYLQFRPASIPVAELNIFSIESVRNQWVERNLGHL